MIFTARDAYHYFRKWPIGPNMRLHKRGPRWMRKHHVCLEGQHLGIPICDGVFIFENGCRISSDEKLMQRGERRQRFFKEMEEEGADPGPANRFYLAARAPDDDIGLLADFRPGFASLILPSIPG